METDLYEHSDYREYLKAALALKNKGIGSRADLARYLNCQTSFISQICTDRAHFSLEHAVLVSCFLQHTKLETKLFMLLVQKERAGSNKLTLYFQEQINHLKKDRQIIKEKIQVGGKIKPQDQATYYSYWWYSAVHIATSLPSIKTATDLAQFLNIPIIKIKEVLTFLLKCGMIIENKNSEYSIGENRIHLSTDSPLLVSHHKNWRTQVLKQFDSTDREDIHFSGVIGVSQKDALKIRKMILEVFKKSEPILQNSAEDSMYVFLTDFYKV